MEVLDFSGHPHPSKFVSESWIHVSAFPLQSWRIDISTTRIINSTTRIRKLDTRKRIRKPDTLYQNFNYTVSEKALQSLYQDFNYSSFIVKRNIFAKSDISDPSLMASNEHQFRAKNSQKQCDFRAFPRKSEKKCLCKMLITNSLKKMTKKDEKSYRLNAISVIYSLYR